jgi:hypothetical protein
MTRFFCFALIFCSSLALAQKITISGSLIDKETREPLAFATVSIKDRSVATISNQAGAFDFHLSSAYRNEILVVSMLGYNNFEAPVWSVTEDMPVVIELIKSTTVLDEVVILEQYTGEDIIRIALSRVEQNYPMEPFLLNGFYRDIRKVAGTYIGLLEAALKIYDQDYAAPRNRGRLRERVKLVEVRKSLGYDSRFSYYFDQSNFLEDLLLQNDIRYRLISDDEEYLKKANRLPDSYYNDREIYVVDLTSDHYLQLSVDKQTFGIVQIKYEQKALPEIVERKRNLASRKAGLTRTIDFRMIDGKFFPGYMQLESKVNWYDINTNEFKFETVLLQQLLINDVQPKTTERISAGEKMRNYSLQFQDRPYNKTFWENYNVIKESPLDRKVLEDLEKGGSLQSQFERTHL